MWFGVDVVDLGESWARPMPPTEGRVVDESAGFTS